MTCIAYLERQSAGFTVSLNMAMNNRIAAPQAVKGLNAENRGRQPRFSCKGGEELSPYETNYSRRPGNLLDGKRTFCLSLSADRGEVCVYTNGQGAV